jgi:hypothetical protein
VSWKKAGQSWVYIFLLLSSHWCLHPFFSWLHIYGGCFDSILHNIHDFPLGVLAWFYWGGMGWREGGYKKKHVNGMGNDASFVFFFFINLLNWGMIVMFFFLSMDDKIGFDGCYLRVVKYTALAWRGHPLVSTMKRT